MDSSDQGLAPPDRDAMIRTVLTEAASQDPDGWGAVASVIRNRLAAGSYGSTPSAIVKAPGQFEVWQNGHAQGVDPNSPNYQAAGRVVDAVAAGGPDITNGATHFYSPSGQQALGRNTPSWGQGKPQAAIGGQLFYAPNGPVASTPAADPMPTPQPQAVSSMPAQASQPSSTSQAGLSDQDLLSMYAKAPASGSAVPSPATAAAPAAPVSDDDLLKLYAKPAAQVVAASQPQASGGQWWQGATGNSVEDAAARAGIGAVRGGKDVLDTLAHGLAEGTDAATGFLANHGVVPQSWANAVHGSAQDAVAADQQGNKLFDAAYGDSGLAGAGRIGGQVLATIPLAMATGGAAVGAGRVGTAVDALAGGNKLLTAAGRGAAGGALISGLTSSASDAPLSDQLIHGAEMGAVAGPIISGASKVANNLLSPYVDPAVAGLAQKAADFGIPLRPAQLTGSGSFLSNVDQKAGQMPFSGRAQFNAEQQSAFNKAVAGTFGESTDSITPDVMARAKERIGNMFDQVAKKSTVNLDPQLGQDLVSTLSDAGKVLPSDSVQPLKNQVGEIWDALAKNGQLSGDQYLSLTRKGTPLDRLQGDKDPNVAFYASKVRNALDDALQRSSPPDVVGQLTDARRQYKNMMTVAPLVVKGDEGAINPLLLNGRVNSSFGNRAFTGAGDLGDLAQIGQQFMKAPKDSGTPTGSAIVNMLTNPGTAMSGLIGAAGTGYALDVPNLLLGATAGAAGMGTTAATSKLVNSALGSQLLKNRLLSLAARGSGGVNGGNKLINATLPPAVP